MLWRVDVGFSHFSALGAAARWDGEQVEPASLRQFAACGHFSSGVRGDLADLGNPAIRDGAETNHLHVGAADLGSQRVGRQVSAQPVIHLEEGKVVGIRHDLDAVDVRYGYADDELLCGVVFTFDGNSPSRITRVHGRYSRSRTIARTVWRFFGRASFSSAIIPMSRRHQADIASLHRFLP